MSARSRGVVVSATTFNLKEPMRIALGILPLALGTVAQAQFADAHGYGPVKQHTIRSSVNRLDYRLLVSLPSQYSANDTTTYPVLYALDGNDVFPLIHAVRRYLQEGGAIPRIIIVAVGYPDAPNKYVRRRMDLTTSSDPRQDSLDRREYLPPTDVTSRLPSGGAPALLETLRRDVIPFIERTYHARSDRGLVGHSFGGLFTLYALHAAPDLFRRYGIFSPATWWDNHRLLDQVSSIGQPRGPADARVFVAVGADEDPGMRNEADSVAAILTRVYGTALTLSGRRGAGNHVTYFPEALGPGLEFLYPNPVKSRCLQPSASVGGRVYTVLSEPARIVTERFTHTGNEISGQAFPEGDMLCYGYRLTLGANGRATASQFVEQSTAGWATRTVLGELRGSRLSFRIGEAAQDISLDVAEPPALFVPFIVGSLKQFALAAPARVGDSTRIVMSNFRRGDAMMGTITRLSTDSLHVRHPRFDAWIRISDQREILSGTTSLGGAAPKQWVVVREK